MVETFTVETQGLRGYVVVDRLVRGLTGGGFRFHPSVNLPEMKALARTMTLKWALLELPFGGSKLGIRGSPNRVDKRNVVEEFAKKLKTFVKGRLFTGPDMGTSPADLRPFFQVVGEDSYDVVAKVLIKHGYKPSPKATYRAIMRTLQADITGLAVARATQTAWRNVDGSLKDVRVSVQGFGSVGKAAAEELARLGASVVCIADARGCLWNAKGLDLRGLVGQTPGIMSREGLPQGTEALSGHKWIETDAEILVPAAVSHAINQRNVEKVRARMVVEAANIPVPEDVELELHSRGVLVLPDFAVNGGLAATFGVLLTGVWEDPKKVQVQVVRRIESSVDHITEGALTRGVPPREVANELAASWRAD